MPIYEVKCPVCCSSKIVSAKMEEKIICTCGAEMVKVPSVANLIGVG